MFSRLRREIPMTAVAVPEAVPNQVDAHRAEAAGYKSRAPEVRAQMLDLVARFAGLVDEAMALTSEATALDERSALLAGEARSRGEDVPMPASVYEDMVHALRDLDRDFGMHLTRVWTGARRGRRAAAKELFELSDAVERGRR
jgi:hypothetical protein